MKPGNSRPISETLAVRGYTWKYSKVLGETPGKTVWFRIATRAGEFMLNYTASFENISVMTDKRNSPHSVKLLFQNASEKVSCSRWAVNINNIACRKITRKGIYSSRYYISSFFLNSLTSVRLCS